jgi:thiamine biosynthesis protein ThiI
VKFDLVIIRYGEIGLKAKETRKRFENTLIKNIRNVLKNEKIHHEIKRELGRIYVYTDEINETISFLKRIFGITSVSPAVYTKSSIILMSRIAVHISKLMLSKDKNFALRVSRFGEHAFSSRDVAVKIGNDIVKSTKANVNLNNPDFELFIEIRNEYTYFYTEKIRGIGGLPLGTQGKVLALVNNFQSILAAWYIMKRGCDIIFVYSNKKILKNLNLFATNYNIKPNLFFIDLKKDIYKRLNKLIDDYNCDAIVTGHTLIDDQRFVISEITDFKENVNSVLLNPLIGMKKEEIEKKSREIGISI